MILSKFCINSCCTITSNLPTYSKLSMTWNVLRPSPPTCPNIDRYVIYWELQMSLCLTFFLRSLSDRAQKTRAPHFLRSMKYLFHVRIDPGIIEPLMRSVLNKMKIVHMLSFAVRPTKQRRWTNSIWTSDKMNCTAWIRCLSMHSSVIWPHEKLCLLVCRPIFFGSRLHHPSPWLLSYFSSHHTHII